MVIFVGDADVTSLPAIRTIIQPIHAEANIVLRLAEATILLADALRLGLIALRAKDEHLHDLLVERTNPVQAILGQVSTRDKRVWMPLVRRLHVPGFNLSRFSLVFGEMGVFLRAFGFLTLQNTHASFVVSLQT
jgi:hypothetical protein